MKPYHKACGSDKLIKIVEQKGRKSIVHDYCRHCVSIIESYDIQRPSPIVVRKVSFDDAVNTEENRKAVISKCFPKLIV